MRRDDKQRLRELERHMTAILDGADADGRDLNGDEVAQFDRLEEEARSLSRQLGREERRGQGEGGNGAGEWRTAGRGGRDNRSEVVLAPDESLAEFRSRSRFFDTDRDDPELDPSTFSVGRLMVGMATGKWAELEGEAEARALSNATDSAGGFVSPEPVGAQVLDRVRNKMRVMEAGATVVPMPSDKYSIPRLATGVTPAWRNEGAAVAESDPTFERVSFQARTVAVFVRASYELVADMPTEAARLLETELTQALALEIDRVALRGSGTAPEPRGVRNQTGVSILTNGANGAVATFDMVVAAVSDVESRGFDVNAVISNARLAKSLAGLKDTTGQYLAPPAYIRDTPILDTAQVPINLTVGTSTDTSEIYAGAWSNLLLGVRPEFGVAVQRSGGPGGAIALKRSEERYIESMQVVFLCFARVDVQLAHPEAFTVNTGIRP